MNEQVIQRVVYPMIAGKANRVLVLISTARALYNWFNQLIKRALQPESKIWAIVFDFAVCGDCRDEGASECWHAPYLTPPWFDPEKAKEVYALANAEAMSEMHGLQHGESEPAYNREAVEAFLANRIPVGTLGQTIVVGVDPNGGGGSELGLMAATVLGGRLVVLGWGLPGVNFDVLSSRSHVFNVVTEFLRALLARYGRSTQLFVCVEANTKFQTIQIVQHLETSELGGALVCARENRGQPGILKDHTATLRGQQLWHTYLHAGAGVAEDAVIFTGAHRERGWVEEELERQLLEYERQATKTSYTFSGKRGGRNDDLSGGAGMQVVLGIQFLQTDRYPRLRLRGGSSRNE